MLKQISYITLLIMLSGNIKAIDPQFSQFYANSLYLGPSFAGAIEGSRLSAQHRNQWYELSSSFKTYSFSFDHYFKSFNSGLGCNFMQDVAGSSELGFLQAGIHYSYNFEIFNIWHVRPGLSFSYVEEGIFGNVLFIDQLRTDAGPSSASGQALEEARDIDAASSLIIYTKGFWLGATVDHLLKPEISLYSTKDYTEIKTSVYGGIDVHRRGRLLKPSEDVLTFAFLYKQQGTVRQLDLGAYWYNYPINIGLWYRGLPTFNSQRGDAAIFMLGLKFTTFNIGYSYDFTISNVLQYTRGSHEISATYKFNLTKKKKKGGLPCPEF